MAEKDTPEINFWSKTSTPSAFLRNPEQLELSLEKALSQGLSDKNINAMITVRRKMLDERTSVGIPWENKRSGYLEYIFDHGKIKPY